MKAKISLFIGAALLTAACGTPVEDEAVQPSINGGKADGLGVSVIDGLDFGEDVQGRFESDLQFDAYEFLVGERSKVTLDVTRKGSSSKVDTTMFIFGPKQNGEYPDNAIVFDDDDGFGKLSRVDDFRLFREGVYMVVIGTKDGRGRGHYNLSLECNSDSCKPKTPGVEVCDPMVQDVVADCMDFVFNESEFELGEPPSNADLINDCLIKPPTNSIAEDWYLFEGDVAGICEESDHCDSDLAADPSTVLFAWACETFDRDWCDQGQPSFEEKMIPACVESLTIPELPELDLTEIPIAGADMRAIESVIGDLCGELCFLNIQAFSYGVDELPNLKAVTLLMAFEHGATFGAGTVFSETTQPNLVGLAVDLQIEEEFIIAVENVGFDLTKDHPVGVAGWTGMPFPSVDVSDEMWVLVDEENKQLLAVEFSSASE